MADGELRRNLSLGREEKRGEVPEDGELTLDLYVLAMVKEGSEATGIVRGGGDSAGEEGHGDGDLRPPAPTPCTGTKETTRRR